MNYILDMLKFSAEQDIQVGSSHKPMEMQDMNSERRQGWVSIKNVGSSLSSANKLR